jgi:hypothetical protein
VPLAAQWLRAEAEILLAGEGPMTPSERTSLEKLMAHGEGRPVRLSALGGRESFGEVRVQRWSSRDRAVRAAKVWAACWALAVVSVFVPAAHFILVPAFLAAGPIAGYFTARTRSSVLGGRAPCPACGEVLLVAGGREEWPLDDVCGACRVQVVIELDNSPTRAAETAS